MFPALFVDCGSSRTTSVLPQLRSSFLLPRFLFFFLHIGDVVQLKLPANMKDLDLGTCSSITGAFLVKTVNESYSSYLRPKPLFLPPYLFSSSFLPNPSTQATSRSWSFRRGWRSWTSPTARSLPVRYIGTSSSLVRRAAQAALPSSSSSYSSLSLLTLQEARTPVFLISSLCLTP